MKTIFFEGQSADQDILRPEYIVIMSSQQLFGGAFSAVLPINRRDLRYIVCVYYKFNT